MAICPVDVAQIGNLRYIYRDATCADCGKDLGRHAWIMLDKARRAISLACPDLDHLVFLPAGDVTFVLSAITTSVS